MNFASMAPPTESTAFSFPNTPDLVTRSPLHSTLAAPMAPMQRIDLPAFTTNPSRSSPMMTTSPGKSMLPVRRSRSPCTSRPRPPRSCPGFDGTFRRIARRRSLTPTACSCRASDTGTGSLRNATAAPRTVVPILPSCFGMRVASTSPFFTRVNRESSRKLTRAASGCSFFGFSAKFPTARDRAGFHRWASCPAPRPPRSPRFFPRCR